jgi:hypothetical protein
MSNSYTSDLPAFKRAYNKAVKEGQTSFMFSGNEVLVSYAKYVIEYLQKL